MNKILKSIAAAVLLAAPLFTNAQVASRLQFPNSNLLAEFGFSVAEYQGCSVIGTEFNNEIKVFKDGNFRFTAAGTTGLFGHAVGLNQNFIAAGAYQTNNNRGVVYLSKHVNGQPQNNFNTIISAQAPVNNDQFGRAVDLSNEWMVVGAPNVNDATHAGYIEIWKLTNGSWSRNKVIRPVGLPSDANYGFSVAIKGDRIVVGAPGISKVYIYRYLNSNWTLEKEFQPNITTWAHTLYDYMNQPVYSWNFGYDVDITDNNIIVGDPTSMKAGILTLQNGVWVLAKTLTAPASVYTSQYYGHSVAIQYNRAIVGAPRSAGGGINRPDEGKVYLYTDGYNYKGYMYVGSPANMTVRALGMGVAIDSDNILAGASNSDNFLTRGNEGGAFRMPFHYVYSTGNLREGDESAFVSAEAKIFPNPAAGIEVQYNVAESITSADAISTTGQVISLSVSENTINVGNLQKGVYSLKINTASGSKIEKFVKE